jgi:TPR repeat protein
MRLRYTALAMIAAASVLAHLGRAAAFEPRRAYQDVGDALVLKVLRSQAEHGDARSQYIVGVIYRNGRGVTHDDCEAAIWFRRAAEQGHTRAQFQLGLMYEQGLGGLPRDDMQAYTWYILSDVMDDPLIKEALDRVGRTLSLEQRAAAAELARNWQPIGYSPAGGAPRE